MTENNLNPAVVPEVSIVLPVYEGEAYLKECLESILSQTFTSFELLISDDGSKDKSMEIIRSFKDARIRVLTTGPRNGLFANLNYLITNSKAPLIRFFCQDDVMEPGCIQHEVDFFNKHADIGISYCRAHRIDQKGIITEMIGPPELPAVIQPALVMQHFYYHGCIPGNLSTVCIRRESLRYSRMFDTYFSVSGDFELWYRICRKFAMGYIHQPLISLRLHKKQLSRRISSMPSFVSENIFIRARIFPYLPPETQKDAQWYELTKHHVLDFHMAVRLFLGFRFIHAAKILFHLGFTRTMGSGFFWLISLNNRFFRPKAKWVLTEDEKEAHAALSS